jgi:hypothetical protein
MEQLRPNAWKWHNWVLIYSSTLDHASSTSRNGNNQSYFIIKPLWLIHSIQRLCTKEQSPAFSKSNMKERWKILRMHSLTIKRTKRYMTTIKRYWLNITNQWKNKERKVNSLVRKYSMPADQSRIKYRVRRNSLIEAIVNGGFLL